MNLLPPPQGLNLLSLRIKAAMAASQGVSLDGTQRRTLVAEHRASSMRGRISAGMPRSSTSGVDTRRITAQALLLAAGQEAASCERAGAGRGACLAGLGLPDPLPASAGAHWVMPGALPAAAEFKQLPAGIKLQDKDFFPELPRLLEEASDRLGRLLALTEQLTAARAAAAAAEPGAAAGSPREASTQSDLSSSRSSQSAEAPDRAARAHLAPAGGSKQLHWADGQETPRLDVPEQAQQEAQQAQQSPGSPAPAGGAATPGEKALRKGFRRRTWAGPAWLDAITGKVGLPAGRVRGGRRAVPCALQPLAPSPAVVTLPASFCPHKHLQPLSASLLAKARRTKSPGLIPSAAGHERLAGYAQEPSSSEDGGGAFNLGSSEEEDEGVVDRRAPACCCAWRRGRAGVEACGRVQLPSLSPLVAACVAAPLQGLPEAPLSQAHQPPHQGRAAVCPGSGRRRGCQVSCVATCCGLYPGRHQCKSGAPGPAAPICVTRVWPCSCSRCSWARLLRMS